MRASVRTCTLASGSSGNALLLSRGEHRLMLDAGISCRRLVQEMEGIGVDPRSIKALFLSHEHSDHACGLPVFARRFRIPVYAHRDSWLRLRLTEKQREAIEVRYIRDGDIVELGPWKVYPFNTYHDSDASLAFKFDGGTGTVSVLTDTGHVSERMFRKMLGSDLVYLEANYDEGMLWNGPYPWPLKRRIASKYGHLSNLHAAAVILRLQREGTEHFVLTHLSENNNTPELAYRTVLSCLEDQGLVLSSDIRLDMAPRHEAGAWFEAVPAALRKDEQGFEYSQETLSYLWG